MNASPQTAAKQESHHSRFVTIGDIRWHIKSVGEGPVCFLIHGTGASVHSWDNLVGQLAAHFTLVMIDLPGHARSATPRSVDLSLPAIASAIHTLLVAENIVPEVIIGHSAGSAIMLELCLQHPESAQQLISINGAVMPLNGVAGYLFAPLAKLSANNNWMPRFFAYRARNPRNIKKLLDSTGSVIDQQSFDRYTELFSNEAHVSGVLRLMANWQLENLLPRLGNVKQPVLLIAASDDSTIPLRDSYRLMQHLPDTDLCVINARGHLVHEEDAAAVAQLIINRLSNISVKTNVS